MGNGECGIFSFRILHSEFRI